MTQQETNAENEDESVSKQSGPHGQATTDDCKSQHETVDTETRQQVLEQYNHRCQTCGRTGPQNGGLATLHIHHLTRNPDGMDEHDSENVTVLCRRCHNWHHQQTREDATPVEITDEDLRELLPQDIELLRILAEKGPATTGELAAELTADTTVMTVRERLWVLMGLDNLVDSRDRQIVDQDVETGRWGLHSQIANSARGHIADDPQTLLQRMEDEQVRQALQRGCDRDAIADVLDIAHRTTFHKEKRAYAYDFPLDALDDGRGGRPPESQNETNHTTGTANDVDNEEQQRLDTVVNGSSVDKSALTSGSTDNDAGNSPNELRAMSNDGQQQSQSSETNLSIEDVRDDLQAIVNALKEAS